ncbi:MAG TPA: YbaK/EbsC family protein [Polyangia bacterium]|nr:YbaK/EbsC family protein [Polyangia bacterium]
MVPDPIKNYLDERGVPFRASDHPYEVTAQRTAQKAHVSGRRFGKTVVLKQDGRYLLAVVPATETVDLLALRDLLGPGITLASEEETVGLFPSCEAGAMPPLGGLYGLPVIADGCLENQPTITFNAGTHTDVIELRWDDFVMAEHPRIIMH